MHVDRVVAWLDRLGLSPDDLECGPQIPTHEPSAHAVIRAGTAPTRAHNNCSGKHSGMLTTAVHLGEPTRSEEHTSELQSLMRRSYAVFCLKKNNQHIKNPTI